ncbi:unnamed protein product [marine sediment metagenome]|uniref:Uncharacterized protein n=1 Tax=marine sediment metagenome TaxID=412755 RepID=X0WZM5_9ZZZZ
MTTPIENKDVGRILQRLQYSLNDKIIGITQDDAVAIVAILKKFLPINTQIRKLVKRFSSKNLTAYCQNIQDEVELRLFLRTFEEWVNK